MPSVGTNELSKILSYGEMVVHPQEAAEVVGVVMGNDEPVDRLDAVGLEPRDDDVLAVVLHLVRVRAAVGGIPQVALAARRQHHDALPGAARHAVGVQHRKRERPPLLRRLGRANPRNRRCAQQRRAASHEISSGKQPLIQELLTEARAWERAGRR